VKPLISPTYLQNYKLSKPVISKLPIQKATVALTAIYGKMINPYDIEQISYKTFSHLRI
jgi:hypothetical protein